MNFVILAERLENVTRLHAVQIVVPRSRILQMNQVLVQKRNDLEPTIDASKKDELLVDLTVDDLIVAADS